MIKDEVEVLFIGGLFFDYRYEQIINESKSAIQFAANKLQWNYVRGLEENLSRNIKIINSVFVGTFPLYYKKIFMKTKKVFRDNNTDRYDEDLGFINLPILNSNSKYFILKKHVNKWARRNNKKKVVIVYGFFKENIKLISYIKRKYPDICSCLIILDLPQFMSQYKRFYHRWTNNHIYDLYKKNKKYIDCYSVISSQVVDYLDIEEPNVVIEGMVTSKLEVEEYVKKPKEKFTFLYTGGLSREYGTEELLSSFMKLKGEDKELVICGDGPYKENVKRAAQKDKRIKYLGIISQDKCVKLQREVDCLVNPRGETEMTKYSFPSKMLEYLTSGTPIIAKYLEGMPLEYKNLFWTYGKNQRTLLSMMEQIVEISTVELCKKAEYAREYVLKEKNNVRQTQRLLDMIFEIIQGAK